LVHATAGGELFETWVMLNERFLQSNPPDVVGRFEPTHQASLDRLIDYFGEGPPLKESALKIIRDKTAFHYDRLALNEASDNLAAGDAEHRPGVRRRGGSLSSGA
jgi:hypothetical protein